MVCIYRKKGVTLPLNLRKMKLQRYILIALLAATALAGCKGSYSLEDQLLDDLERQYDIEITASGKDYEFIPQGEILGGVAFYPGGKVEDVCYAPLLAMLANRGYLCRLYHMPSDLAIFDTHAAHHFPDKHPECGQWWIGGHSLGGAAAAMCLNKHKDDFDGLFLLAAYSNKDISDYEGRVVSIYGSADGVLNRENYEAYKANLPEGWTEYVIDGGCHSYFGYYGMQEGDGEPSISRADQICRTVEILTDEMAAHQAE